MALLIQRSTARRVSDHSDTGASSAGNTRRTPVPVMGPADPYGTVPVMGPADSYNAIPVMGPADSCSAVPVMGQADPGIAVPVMGPADRHVTDLMSPRR